MTTLQIADPHEMHEFGRLLGAQLQRGDVVVLHGPLGAGKTTLARGIGEAIGVVGAIQSPTFVVSREHRNSSPDGPSLVHIDAYRLSRVEELVDLDIDYDNCVSLIEWGRPFVAGVASEWLDVEIQRPEGGDDADILSAEGSPRRLVITARGLEGHTPLRMSHLVEALDDSRH